MNLEVVLMLAGFTTWFVRIAGENADPWFRKQLEIFIQEVNEFLQRKQWKSSFEEFIHNHTAFFGGNVTTYSEGHYDVWEAFKRFTGNCWYAGVRVHMVARLWDNEFTYLFILLSGTVTILINQEYVDDL